MGLWLVLCVPNRPGNPREGAELHRGKGPSWPTRTETCCMWEAGWGGVQASIRDVNCLLKAGLEGSSPLIQDQTFSSFLIFLSSNAVETR